MSNYYPPLRDMRFVLQELLQVSADDTEERLTVDGETLDQILEAAGRFASEVLAPLNPIGDRQGCQLTAAGGVETPSGFKAAYQDFTTAGWTALSCLPEYGGQGLPQFLNNAVYEMLCGANMAWAAYPGMSHAAYTCIEANGTPEQKARYLPKIASGAWAGTMCLTEPHCGTDLGLLRTRAVPQADGTYQLSGTNIFISGGEQDLTENIVHLVLARIENAPPGVKGISLFIVPKLLQTPQHPIGQINALGCSSIERKLGIHANATCTMNFEGSKGWLIGEENRGLAAMFVMMNHARLAVGVNAIGLMEAAYQKSLSYAKDRAQGRAPVPSRAGADFIIEHPDVRRMLLTQKAYVEGARAFALWAASMTDQDESARAGDAAELLSLITPVVKAFCSEVAVECASLAIQVHGGHGYIVDNLVEQHLRDARIIPLYEGANGVQAMDLLGRKVAGDGGQRLDLYLTKIERFAAYHSAVGEMEVFCRPLKSTTELIRELARELIASSKNDPSALGCAATPFLNMMGHVSLAWMWARMAAIGLGRTGDADPIYAAKVNTARFYFEKILPQTAALASEVRAGTTAVMALPVEAF